MNISKKKLARIQIRLPLQKKSKWKALASIYTGGNLTMLIDDAVERWDRRYLIKSKPDLKKGRP